MTVREYIGARYVPIFMGEWDNTKTYEPLSIVQHQGNSFTSRQFVPTGVAIDNDDYWAETGNYNAQVEQYRQEVLSFDGRITDVENDVNALEVQVNTLLTQPLVIGRDYISDIDYTAAQFSAVVRHDDTFYGIFCENITNECHLRRYDDVSGAITDKGTVNNGHANSMCYIDSIDRIACCWLNDYVDSDGNGIETGKVTEYDSSFNFIRTVTSPVNLRSISYDSVTGKLYGLERISSVAGNRYCNLYELNTSDYTVKETIGRIYDEFSINANLQDMAINNGIVYLDTPGGYFVVYSIADLSKPIYETQIYNNDAFNVYNLGEIEGIEFDENGSMYAATFVRYGRCVYGFTIALTNVNQLPVFETIGETIRTLTCSDAYRTDWKRKPYHIGNLMESNVIIHPTVNIIKVTDGYEDDAIYFNTLFINREIYIELGNCTMKPIVIASGNCTLQINANKTANFVHYTGSTSALLRPESNNGVMLTFNNLGTINNDIADGEFISLAYNKRPCTIGNKGTSNFPLRIGNVVVKANTIYIGGHFELTGTEVN